jgi:hypothetical protein
MKQIVRIEWQHLLSRLGGISTPFGGASLRLPESEKDVVRGVIVFLEDRRVLYENMYLEVPSQVVSSLLDIRKELTGGIKKVEADSPAAKSFKAMQAACRRFLTDTPADFPHIGDGPKGRNGMDAGFFASLGALRAAFGQHLAELAYLYNVDLSEELAAILPAEPRDDDDDAPERRYWRY